MKTLKWGLLYTAAFLAAFVGSALLKMNSDPTHGKYNTRWDETVGKAYTDLPYGEGAANKFDLYVPADKSQDAYGLVVYLHAGGFTGGDKAEDAEMLEWLCTELMEAEVDQQLGRREKPAHGRQERLPQRLSSTPSGYSNGHDVPHGAQGSSGRLHSVLRHRAQAQ